MYLTDDLLGSFEKSVNSVARKALSYYIPSMGIESMMELKADGLITVKIEANGLFTGEDADRISVGFLNSFVEEWEGSVYDIKYKGIFEILKESSRQVYNTASPDDFRKNSKVGIILEWMLGKRVYGLSKSDLKDFLEKSKCLYNILVGTAVGSRGDYLLEDMGTECCVEGMLTCDYKTGVVKKLGDLGSLDEVELQKAVESFLESLECIGKPLKCVSIKNTNNIRKYFLYKFKDGEFILLRDLKDYRKAR